jgi:hypothetical protein
MEKDLEYWKARCIAAEHVIRTTPCDLDISGEQIQAVFVWMDLVAREDEE